ncbi:MAG TPA: hypothetical protein VLS89_13555 [Candidatus Nanopelagicales bacterium]|nr:hypothetical protein [Candidatus Nanopelagicales bacterium]
MKDKKSIHAKSKTENPFEKALEGALESSPQDATFDSVIAVLHEVADGIHTAIFRKDGRVEMRVEPGFLVNMGQQLNLVVAIDGFRDTLFRAYVPVDGFPVTLDLFGEEGFVCKDEAELKATLIDFLKKKEVLLRLRGLHSLITQSTGGAARGRGSAA